MPRQKYSVSSIAIAAGCRLLRLMPARVASGLMAFAASIFSRYVLKEKVIRMNLRLAFPDLDRPAEDALLKKIAGNFGRVFAEIIHIPTYVAGKQGASVTPAGSLDYTFKQLGQAVYVTAHVGNWELIPIALTPITTPLIIYTPIGDPAVNNLLLSMRRKTGANYVEKSKALRACIDAMKKGNSLGILIDQRVQRGIKIKFFGHPTIFTDLPARLAIKFDVPIIPVAAIRNGPNQCQVMVYDPIWPDAGQGDNAVSELTQQTANAIENIIRARPEQWCCDKRRWRKRDLAEKLPESPAGQDDALETGKT